MRVTPAGRQAPTVSLGLQELRASLMSRDRAHGKHHVNGIENAPSIRQERFLLEASAHSAAQRFEAEIVASDIGRGDEDEYSR